MEIQSIFQGSLTKPVRSRPRRASLQPLEQRLGCRARQAQSQRGVDKRQPGGQSTGSVCKDRAGAVKRPTGNLGGDELVAINSPVFAPAPPPLLPLHPLGLLPRLARQHETGQQR